MIRRLFMGACALSALLALPVAQAGDSRAAIDAEIYKPLVRGGIVFKNYCVSCHGEKGDGDARAAKLHGTETLQIKEGSDASYEEIIRKGGEAVGKSPFMPMWGEELSDEQIKDVVIYVSYVTNQLRRGEAVFKTNCILCHGIKGDGKGRAAKLYNPPPANLTLSDKNDEYKRMIISMGGAAMGRSDVMPVWSEQLSPQEIDDVVSYLRTLVVQKPQ